MSETVRLLALVGDIYDAALDSSLWPRVLESTRDFVGGEASSLYWSDIASKNGNIFYDDGRLDPNYKKLYFEKYIKFDPTLVGRYCFEVGKLSTTSDIIDYDEFLDTRLYKEWGKPQGFVDFATVILSKSETSVAIFGVFRHERQGMADAEMLRLMQLVVPHIQRAALIGRAIDLKTAEASIFADCIDGLSAGIFFVDATGRIVHANTSGQAMLSAGDIARHINGRLVANDGRAAQALREVFEMAGGGDKLVGVTGIAIPLVSTGGARYLAHVLPLTSGARRQASRHYAAVAAVFVRKAELETPAMPEIIATTFGLTPSELRVLLAIVEMTGIAETAAALGIAETTVKTHLQRLFAKTGAARQSELVKLVAGFSTPLLG